jgi:hypothetical protein
VVRRRIQEKWNRRWTQINADIDNRKRKAVRENETFTIPGETNRE